MQEVFTKIRRVLDENKKNPLNFLSNSVNMKN